MSRIELLSHRAIELLRNRGIGFSAHRLIGVCAAVALLASTSLGQQVKPAADAIVLRGGTLLTITQGTIKDGVLVMQGGKITAVGAAGAVQIPAGARVIDVKGMTVYPGFIDSETRLGLTEISADPMTNDLVEPSHQIMPHMRVADAFHAESELIPVTRVNGVTNAVVQPGNADTLPGQASLVQLAGKDRDEMLLATDIALPLNFTGRQRRRQSFEPGGRGEFPATRMGMAAQLRQAFLDAQDYARKLKKKSGNPQNDEEKKDEEKDFKRDLRLEALLPYLNREKPVVLTAEEPSDVKTALALAREFNLRIILGRLTYAQPLLDEIAGLKAPVIVGSIYEAPKDDQRYDATYRLPAELHRRGIKFAFASFDEHNARNLPYQAGYAVAFGLPYEEALKALTLYPAEIWGVADRLGSLEPGKTANVVVANGDPLDVKTDVKHVFIAGREVPMDNRQIRLRDQYWAK